MLGSMLGLFVGGVMSGRRSPAPRYRHGYCPIGHLRQDTAERCANSAAYHKLEVEAITQEILDEEDRRIAREKRAAWVDSHFYWLLAGAGLLLFAVILTLLTLAA